MIKSSKHTKVIILIASDFDEEAVIYILCQMRRRGIKVFLVGIPSNIVIGAFGLAVHPDYSLSQLREESQKTNDSLLIIPGESNCTTTLLSDPRVLHIITRIFAEGGIVATTSSNLPKILTNMGVLDPSILSCFLVQGTQSLSNFTELLIGYIG